MYSIHRVDPTKNKELMPLECLCRLVTAGVESRVTAATKAAMEAATTTPSPLGAAESRSTGGSSTIGTAGVPLGSIMDGAHTTPSVLHMAYVELLRTLVSRLERGGGGGVHGGTVGSTAAALEGRRRIGERDGRTGGRAWAGIRALNLETLFR